jgi:hypothetical protein
MIYKFFATALLLAIPTNAILLEVNPTTAIKLSTSHPTTAIKLSTSPAARGLMMAQDDGPAMIANFNSDSDASDDQEMPVSDESTETAPEEESAVAQVA